MMRCPDCNTEYADGMRTCDVCGAALPFEEGEYPAGPYLAPDENRRKGEEEYIPQSSYTATQYATEPFDGPRPLKAGTEPQGESNVKGQEGILDEDFKKKDIKKQKHAHPAVSTASFFFMELLSLIPVINIVVLLVLIGNKRGNPSRRNWAKSKLLWAVIGIGVTIWLFIWLQPVFEMAGEVIPNLLNQLNLG